MACFACCRSRPQASPQVAPAHPEPVVHLSPTASVRGEVLTVDGSQKPIFTFNTIPYAKPPVGDLRFKKPEPIDLWEGEKDVRKEGHSPAQTPLYRELMEAFPMPMPVSFDEDCLNLTVSSPDISGDRKLPVMAYFFGGGFQMGTMYAHPGTALASMGDVVYVAINYRVNFFGFFTTGDDVCRGNFGIWDQIEGLRWIQKHISKFGGDPDNVTIFGESAGSFSVTLHHVIPQSKGLFCRSLGQSGVGSSPAAMMEDKAAVERKNKMTAEALGLEENPSSEALFAALNALTPEQMFTKLGEIMYLPCVDNELLQDTWYNLYLAKQMHPQPAIFGVNTDEGAGFVKMFYAEAFGGLKTMDSLKPFLDHCLDHFFPGQSKEGRVEAILEEYLPTAEPSEQDIYKTATDVFGDMVFIGPSLEAAKIHSGVAVGGTYQYTYGYRISFSENEPWERADHADELSLVFGLPFLTKTVTTKRKFKYTAEDKAISKMFISYWTNFAKTGNPNGSGLPEWKLFTPDERSYLFIDRECSQGTDYKSSRVKFWRETFPNL